MVHTMRDLTSGIFEHLEITSPLDIDKRFNYRQRLLRVLALEKYNTVLADYKDPGKGITGDQWTLSAKKGVTKEQLWTWSKQDGINGSGGMYLGRNI